jgi:hypothetical protein
VTEIVRERELRGIPRWLVRGYIEQLGGRGPSPQPSPRGRGSPDSDEDVLVGEGWTARLILMEDYRIGSLRSGQVRLEVRGEVGAVEAMLTALEPRLFRGGG